MAAARRRPVMAQPGSNSKGVLPAAADGPGYVLARGRLFARTRRPAPGRLLHLERAKFFGALGAARGHGRHGAGQAVCLCREPHVCHALSAHFASRSQPRSTRSPRRRVFSLRSEAAIAPRSRRQADRSGTQRRARRPGRATPRKHSSPAGTSFRSRIVHREPPGISRRQGHRASARSDRASARAFCVDCQRRHGRPHPARKTFEPAWAGRESPSNWKARWRRRRGRNFRAAKPSRYSAKLRESRNFLSAKAWHTGT